MLAAWDSIHDSLSNCGVFFAFSISRICHALRCRLAPRAGGGRCRGRCGARYGPLVDVQLAAALIGEWRSPIGRRSTSFKGSAAFKYLGSVMSIGRCISAIRAFVLGFAVLLFPLAGAASESVPNEYPQGPSYIHLDERVPPTARHTHTLFFVHHHADHSHQTLAAGPDMITLRSGKSRRALPAQEHPRPLVSLR